MASNVYTLSFPAPYLGLAQSSYKDENYTIGGNNVFSRIHNCSLYNPNGISNSPLMEDKAVGELLHNITDYCVKTNTAYGISNSKIWSINNNNLISEEHTFAGGNNTYGNSICKLDNYLYYFYNTSSGMNIGRSDLNSTYEDTFITLIGSTSGTTSFSDGQSGIIPTRALNVAGTKNAENLIMFGHGNQLGFLTPTNIVKQVVDMSSDSEIVDIDLHNGYIVVGINNKLSNKNSDVYYFSQNIAETEDTYGYVHINGKIGCLISDNGTLYVVYSTEDNVVRVAYLNGSTLVDITSFKGSLPNCFQKTKVMDFLMLKSGTNVVAIGNSAVGLGVATYNYESCNTDNGCIAAPFNSLIISGTKQLNNIISFITSNYNSDSYVETLTINTDNIDNVSTLNQILIDTNPLLNKEELEVDFYVDGLYHKTEKANNPSGRQEITAPNKVKTLKLVIRWKSNKQVLIKNISFKFNTNEYSSE